MQTEAKCRARHTSLRGYGPVDGDSRGKYGCLLCLTTRDEPRTARVLCRSGQGPLVRGIQQKTSNVHCNYGHAHRNHRDRVFSHVTKRRNTIWISLCAVHVRVKRLSQLCRSVRTRMRPIGNARPNFLCSNQSVSQSSMRLIAFG